MISVIVPVYNCEKYIERCIKSILAQSYHDFELILVDDGSTDNSGQICDRFAETDDRIKVIHQDNDGVSAARNNGVKSSIGEFVSFIDSDDWIEPDYLETLVTACHEHNAQIAICGYVTAVSEHSRANNGNNFLIMTSREAINYYGDLSLRKESAHFRSPWAKLIKREFALNVPFPTDRIYAEDGACVYLWLWQAEKIICLEKEMYYYYQNQDGISNQPIGEHIIGNLLTEEEWIEFFKTNGFIQLYVRYCRRYIEASQWAVDGARDAKNDKAEKLFIKAMRHGLRNYAKPAKIGIKNGSYYYETAYPFLMKVYWFIKSKCLR